jgi:hypothetical protein
VKRDRGSVTIELVLTLSLFLIPTALLVITIPAWPERQTVARAAAAEAARAVVVAGSWESGVAEAEAAVRQAALNQGIASGDISLAVDGGLDRGATVTAAVTITMPALVIPGLTSVGSWSWTARHAERVDDYRSFP